MKIENRKVLIQGVEGSNHHMAAMRYFKGQNMEVVPCLTFRELFSKLEADPRLVGMVAMENTLVGSILTNYTLLRKSGLRIMGEYKLRISHQLMVLPGQRLEDIREVHSHPMALGQCEDYFLNHPHIRLVESEDTALSAKLIRTELKEGVGAIASRLAADLYDLQLIAEDIETNPHNFTRFLLIGHAPITAKKDAKAVIDKASLVFSLHHQTGSLSHVLSVLAFYGINLTKIQSLPVVGQEWEYLFYIDLTFNDYPRYLQALEAIKPLSNRLQVLGEYETFESHEKDSLDSSENMIHYAS